MGADLRRRGIGDAIAPPGLLQRAHRRTRPIAILPAGEERLAVGQRQRQRILPVRREPGRGHPDQRRAPQRHRRQSAGWWPLEIRVRSSSPALIRCISSCDGEQTTWAAGSNRASGIRAPMRLPEDRAAQLHHGARVPRQPVAGQALARRAAAMALQFNLPGGFRTPGAASLRCAGDARGVVVSSPRLRRDRPAGRGGGGPADRARASSRAVYGEAGQRDRRARAWHRGAAGA